MLEQLLSNYSESPPSEEEIVEDVINDDSQILEVFSGIMDEVAHISQLNPDLVATNAPLLADAVEQGLGAVLTWFEVHLEELVGSFEELLEEFPELRETWDVTLDDIAREKEGVAIKGEELAKMLRESFEGENPLEWSFDEAEFEKLHRELGDHLALLETHLLRLTVEEKDALGTSVLAPECLCRSADQIGDALGYLETVLNIPEDVESLKRAKSHLSEAIKLFDEHLEYMEKNPGAVFEVESY